MSDNEPSRELTRDELLQERNASNAHLAAELDAHTETRAELNHWREECARIDAKRQIASAENAEHQRLLRLAEAQRDTWRASLLTIAKACDEMRSELTRLLGNA